MVQLTDDLVELLDTEAERRGISRSALIREAVESHLAEAREKQITQQIIEGYKRIPQDTPDEWGDLMAQSDKLHSELMRELDEEERAAGFDPCEGTGRGARGRRGRPAGRAR